ncbi:MAG TPA: biotin--[acetyl-CoA-carboxylase] ligase [Fimbriimonas sp.]|nr:biotin--[acetyl-CoA-carboxylase] ligase [Fimbriimonas sp.]
MNITGPTIHYVTTTSTQAEAKAVLDGVHWTTNQTEGRGRFDRVWYSEPGNSLAVSICFPSLKGHPKPFLIGMSIALKLAETFDLKLQWPNDLLVGKHKVAGILTEVVNGVPIVGIGLNVGPMRFPEEIAHRATSLANAGRDVQDPARVCDAIIEAINSISAIPENWSELKSRWMERDMTEGKLFRTQDDQVGIAIGISDEGELLWNSRGEFRIVSAADALWGPDTEKKEA